MKVQINLVIESKGLQDIAELLAAFDYEKYITYFGAVIEDQQNLPGNLAGKKEDGPRKIRNYPSTRFRITRERVIELKNFRKRHPDLMKKDFYRKVVRELKYDIGKSTVSHVLRGTYDNLLIKDKDQQYYSNLNGIIQFN